MKIYCYRWSNQLIYFIGLFVVLNLFGSQKLCAQIVKTVSGIVKDSQGVPMVGVTVVLKGKTVGTVTDNDGKFRLAADEKDLVTFSFIGYWSLTIPVTSLNNAIVTLKEDTKSLDEVVVVGYGSQKKETMTGAISQIKASEMIKSPVANMGQALTGRAAGVTTYQRSGEPGADDVTIRIRGTGTLNNASPLVLVDGVEREFTQIDPNEIESMSILKDAASTAVFGIRGANGVIIITTKKGNEGPAKVSVSANFAMQQPIRMPASTDGVTVAKMYNEAKFNDDPTQNPTFTEEDLALYANGNDLLGHPNIDWKDYIMNDFAFQQKYNLSVSGGTKNTKYYTSVAFFDQGGLMKDLAGRIDDMVYKHNYNYQRVNIRSNIDVDLTPTTKIGIQLGGIISKKIAPPDAFVSIIQATAIGAPYIYDRKMIILPNIPWGGSPLQTILGSIEDNNSNTINTNVSFNQKLDFVANGLEFRGLASYDSYYSHTLNKAESAAIYRLQNGFDANGNPAQVLEQAGENAGMVPVPTDSWGRRQSMHAELALEYKKSIGNHSVGALVLGTLDKKWWMYNGSDNISQYTTVPVSYMGLVNRLTYDFKSRYLLEFNVGYNGSENFAEGNRFAWFPALSVGWNVTEESFVKAVINPDILSKLKLRASYGLTGNDNTGGRRFMYYSGEYTSSSGSLFGSSTVAQLAGLVEGKQGNPNVTWETAAKQNFGVDIGLFKNQLSTTFEFFFDDRKDILATRSTEPAHLAISGQDVYNIGRVKNRGFEIDSKWNHNIGKFSYYLSANYSFARNEIIEDGSIKDPVNPQLWTTGHSVGTRWGYLFDGFYTTQEQIDQGPNLGKPTIGEAKYVDVNGDEQITSDDRVAMGYPEIPEINYGFSLGGSYKGFDFSCMFQGAANSTKLLEGIFRRPFEKNQGIPFFVVAERWTPETAETAIRPKLTLAYTSMSYENSNLWTRDGSYLKLRNVEFAYTVSKENMQRLIGLSSFGSMRIFVNGQNLYTWDKLKFVDPESRTASYDHPQLRVFNLGLQVNF